MRRRCQDFFPLPCQSQLQGLRRGNETDAATVVSKSQGNIGWPPRGWPGHLSISWPAAAGLINELVEAQHDHPLRRALAGGAASGPGGRVAVPDHLGSRRAHDGDPDHESALFRVDSSVSQHPTVRGVAGPDHRPRPPHRDRHRLLPVPQNVEEKAEIAASGREGETRHKTHVLRAGPTRDRQ